MEEVVIIMIINAITVSHDTERGNLMFGSLRARFIMMMVGASLITLVGVVAIFMQNMNVQKESEIKLYRETLRADVEREIKIETETARSLIQQFHERQKKGELTEAQAKKMAADLVRDLRYDNGAGYFWIDTYEGVNVVLLGRDAEGKSRINAKDPQGLLYPGNDQKRPQGRRRIHGARLPEAE